jgi:biopolymer transport protein ExbD
MVTSTFKNQPAINLVLPRSATAEETVAAPTVVYLAEDGQLFLNDQALSEDDLGERLRALQAATGEDRLVLRADQASSHGSVVRIIDLVKQSGFTRVSLSTRRADVR